MAEKHELEIEIDRQGRIEVLVKGAKGKKCLQYVELFNTIGKTDEVRKTGEFYEPESKVSITDRQHTRHS